MVDASGIFFFLVFFSVVCFFAFRTSSTPLPFPLFVRFTLRFTLRERETYTYTHYSSSSFQYVRSCAFIVPSPHFLSFLLPTPTAAERKIEKLERKKGKETLKEARSCLYYYYNLSTWAKPNTRITPPSLLPHIGEDAFLLFFFVWSLRFNFNCVVGGLHVAAAACLGQQLHLSRFALLFPTSLSSH